MSRTGSATLLLVALCLAIATGGGEPRSGEVAAPEAASTPSDGTASTDTVPTAYGFDTFDGDGERTAEEFVVWSEGPVFAFHTTREGDGDARDPAGPLDEDRTIDLEEWRLVEPHLDVRTP
jgi:hypothetical protein